MKILRTKQLTFWNTLGSTSDIENSIIGVNGTNDHTTPTYSTGKFNTAVQIPSTDTVGNDIEFANFETGPKGSCGIWIKPNSWSFNGTPSDADRHRFLIAHRTSGNILDFIFEIHETLGIRGYLRDPVTTNISQFYSTNGHFEADKWSYVSMTWDNDIGASAFKALIDGKEIESYTSRTWNGYNGHRSENGSHSLYMNVGKRRSQADQTFDGLLDNVQFWNYNKLDWSDRFIEYPTTIEPGIKSNRRCVLWNKLEEGTTTVASEIGADGVNDDAGSTYTTGKYGNAVYVPDTFADGTEGVYFDDCPFPRTGSLEYWFKPNGWSWSGTSMSDSTTKYMAPFSRWLGYLEGIRLFLQHSSGAFMFITDSSSVNNTGYISTDPIPDGVWTHIALEWDMDGAGFIGIYINGKLQGSVSGKTWTGTTPDTYKMYVGRRPVDATTNGAKGWFDNLKLHNYRKYGDYSDRHEEGLNYTFSPNIKYTKRLLSWSRMGQASDITSPEIGPVGSIPGSVSYVTGQHGNGVQSAANAITFPVTNDLMNYARGRLDVWIKITGVSSATIGSNDMQFFYINDAGSGGMFCRIGYGTNSGRGGAGLFFDWGDDFEVSTHQYSIGASITYNEILFNKPDDWHLYSVLWDEDNVPGTSRKVAMRLDGIPIDNYYVDISTETFIDWISPGNVSPLYYNSVGGTTVSFDNLMIYNYAKTDFSDRLLEEPIDLSLIPVLPELATP